MRIWLKVWDYFLSCLTLIKYKLIYRDRFEFKWSDRVKPSLKIRIDSKGKLVFGDRVSLREHVIINITGGTILLGNDVFFNDMVCINSRDNICIGASTIVGQGVKFYDHDHDYRNDLRNDFRCNPISVKEYVWIGAGAILLKGSTIGAHSVIGAGTLVNTDVPTEAVYVNHREKNIFLIHK
ncbi:MAG: acyltransferase [Lachnospiraceae bacterium]|nr:acyltransferase [Lachnospiraceae bacterium]